MGAGRGRIWATVGGTGGRGAGSGRRRAGPARAHTQPARPLPAAMLAGEWVSNGGRRAGGAGGGSAGSGRSRFLSAIGGRGSEPGPARRSGGEPSSGPEWAPERKASLSPRGRTPPEHRRPRSQPPESATPLLQLGLPLWQDPFPSNRTPPPPQARAWPPPIFPLQGLRSRHACALSAFPVRGLCVLYPGSLESPLGPHLCLSLK